MELLQLKYFRDAARCESFARVAEKYMVPQSNISQSIKRLEGELGTRLFSRTANRIRLTEAGRKFYLAVEESLEILDTGVAVARKGGPEKIKICINADRRIAMEAIESFGQKREDIELYVETFRTPSREYDVIISAEAEIEGFVSEGFLTERMMLAVTRSHPLAERELVSHEDIRSEAFVAMREGSSLDVVTEKIFKSGGATPKIALRTDDPFYFRRCIEAGLGIGIVPELSWRGQFSDEVVLIPFGEYYRDTFCHRRITLHSEEADELISELRTVAEREMAKKG